VASRVPTRPELHERTAFRRPIRIHDLRATFIALALASGRSETWVQDRTGHTTSLMLSKYRRQSRNASELGLGGLQPLNDALPELRGGQKGGQRRWPKKSPSAQFSNASTSSPSRTRTGKPFRARDFKEDSNGTSEYEGRGARSSDTGGDRAEHDGTPSTRPGVQEAAAPDAVELALAQALIAALVQTY
jgi:hypothetical protein